MKTDKLNAFLFIMKFVKPYAPLYFLGVLLYCSQHIMYPIITSVLMGSMTGAVVSGDTAELVRAIFTIIGIFVLMVALVYPGILIYMSLPLRIKQDMQRHAIRAFINRRLDDHDHSGEYLSRFNNDIEEAALIFYHGLIAIVMQGSPIILLGPVIFAINFQLGIFVIICSIVSTLSQMLLVKPLGAVYRDNLERTAKTTATIVDICSGEVIIKAFRLREKIMAVFSKNDSALLQINKKEENYNSIQTIMQRFSQLLTVVGVYIFGSILISRGDLSLPALMAVVPLATAFTYAFYETGSCWVSFQKPLEAGKRVKELLETNEPVLNHSMDTKKYDLVIKNLTFSYSNADVPAVTDVNISINENELVVVSGESGCGKSTLLKLIAGMYECDNLPVYMGSVPFSKEVIYDWRSKVAYVDQDCTLLNLSIAENIKIGKEYATMAEIKEAANLAGADAFISSLPNGYETQAGELGDHFSGGEKQRIAIARAIVKGASIMVFDEITSALDLNHANQINDTIQKLRKNHTIIMATHKNISFKADKYICLRPEHSNNTAS